MGCYLRMVLSTSWQEYLFRWPSLGAMDPGPASAMAAPPLGGTAQVIAVLNPGPAGLGQLLCTGNASRKFQQVDRYEPAAGPAAETGTRLAPSALLAAGLEPGPLQG